MVKNNSNGSVRIEKTNGRLRRALHTLIGEKPYESISVQEILDRAGVGRSTFYAHFGDKDELLLSSIHGIARSARATAPPRSGRWFERMLWFSLPIFVYHYERGHAAGNTVEAPAILHRHLEHALCEIIAEKTGVDSGFKRGVPTELVVRYVATSFVLVFTWWQENKRRLPPDKIDAIFRSLVLPTLAAL